MSLLPVNEAQARLLALAGPLPPEPAPIIASVGRWASADVRALRHQPSHDLSAMDGYAIRHAERPGPWTVVGESAAGGGLDRALGSGEAARIFTGAPVPEGADCVLIQEEATREGDRLTMTGEGPARPGANIRPRGVDFAEGALLLRAGARITARHVALAGAGGHGSLPVRRLPRVALISTGDELVPLGVPTPGAMLPASNAAMLAALLAGRPAQVEDRGIVADDLDAIAHAFRSAADEADVIVTTGGVSVGDHDLVRPAQVEDRGIVADDLDAIAHAFQSAADEADVIVTTGGVSVGDHDLVRPALEAAGATLDFWRVAMRPGKPLLAGRLGGAIILGLPGNPVSSYVTARLFLLPLIARLGGAADPQPQVRAVRLGAALPANGIRQDYLRARLENGLAFAPDGQDSAALAALAAADGLLVRPANAPAAAIGDLADMLDLD